MDPDDTRKTLVSLQKDLERDPALRKRFVRDPMTVLRGLGLSEKKVSSILEKRLDRRKLDGCEASATCVFTSLPD